MWVVRSDEGGDGWTKMGTNPDSNSGSRARSVVVSKLCEREQREPFVLLIVAVDPDVLFQGLVSALGLTVTFRMVPQGKVQLHVQGRA